MRIIRWLFSARITRWVSLIPLVYFAAEWVVSASWRGQYSYREDLLGTLGVAFCGLNGTWPCSELYRAMNVALVVTGLAVAWVAISFLVQRVTQRGHALLLLAAGLGLAASGVVTERVDYFWNFTAVVIFMTLGSVSALFIAMGSTSTLSAERRGVAVVAGLVSLVGYFMFIGGHKVFGPGGAERMAIYGVLVAVIALGTGARRTSAEGPAEPGAHPAEPVAHPAETGAHRRPPPKQRKPRSNLLRAQAVLLAVALSGCAMTVGQTEPPRPRVIFFDDFDGPAGKLPSAQWRIETGGGGWGNNELQVYTNSPANVSLDGAGRLAINARFEPQGRITSAKITTEGSMAFESGRAEARIAVPAGAGLHPAFWLVGSNLDQVGWPEAGEIDIMETLNYATEYNTVIHAPDGSERGQDVGASGPAPFPLAGEFHTYWVERTPGRIVTGVDNQTLLTVTPGDLSKESRWVFDAPFYLLLNLAVGGNWPGPPNASTPNPSTLLVDWVKVTAL